MEARGSRNQADVESFGNVKDGEIFDPKPMGNQGDNTASPTPHMSPKGVFSYSVTAEPCQHYLGR